MRIHQHPLDSIHTGRTQDTGHRTWDTYGHIWIHMHTYGLWIWGGAKGQGLALFKHYSSSGGAYEYVCYTLCIIAAAVR